MEVATLRVLDKRLREQVSRMNPFQVDLDDDAPPLRLVVDCLPCPMPDSQRGSPRSRMGRSRTRREPSLRSWCYHAGRGSPKALGPAGRERAVHVSSLDPARYGPSIGRLRGSIVLQIEERAALEQDLTIATGITAVLVC